MNWTVLALNATVEREIEALAADLRARLVRYVGIIEAHGLRALSGDAVKHLEGELWELRLTGRDGIARAIYVTRSERRVVIVRVFVKKTPGRELEIARQRAREAQ